MFTTANCFLMLKFILYLLLLVFVARSTWDAYWEKTAELEMRKEGQENGLDAGGQGKAVAIGPRSFKIEGAFPDDVPEGICKVATL